MAGKLRPVTVRSTGQDLPRLGTPRAPTQGTGQAETVPCCARCGPEAQPFGVDEEKVDPKQPHHPSQWPSSSHCLRLGRVVPACRCGPGLLRSWPRKPG